MKDKPLYGSIANSRKSWTVTLHKEVCDGYNSTGHIEGYGEFPFSEYPDIPVIDYSSVDFDTAFKSLRILNKKYIIEKRNGIGNYETGITLNKYLDQIKNLGIKVLNRKERE